MTLAGTNTYLVGAAPCWVIDPGPNDPHHIAAVRDAAESRGGIAAVVLTHSHADHSAGVETLGAPLVWGSAEPRPTEEAVGPFTVIPTPGHAADHACFLWGRVLFCGDLILGEGSAIVPPAAHGGSLTDYMDSLARVAELDLELMAPGHGPWITDPAAKVAEYVAHRRERERMLLAAIEAGERSRERLLDAAWGDVPEPMRPAAAMAMQAHLEKLERDGVLNPDTTAP